MSVRKILIVTFDNLGDVVMTTPMLKLLRAQYPGATIGYWVKSYAADLFDCHSQVDRVHASDPFWDHSPGRSKGPFSDFAACLIQVRAEHYDVALILNAEWRRALACKIAGIKERVGYRRRKASIFLTRSFDEPEDQHCADEHRTLLSLWTGQSHEAYNSLPRVEVCERDQKWMDNWLSKLSWKENSIVALHPFAGNPSRWWPLTLWAGLVRSLLMRDPQLKFVLIAAPQDREQSKSAFESLPPASFQVLAGHPLGQVKAAIRAATLMVGADSGPAHMAAAIGTPLVSLFGSTSDPARYAPTGHAPVRILRAQPISELSLPSVESAVLEILEKRKLGIQV